MPSGAAVEASQYRPYATGLRAVDVSAIHWHSGSMSAECSAIHGHHHMLIYRGAGLLILLTPIAAVLLILILFPDPVVGRGNTSLGQVLLAFGLGSAINTVLGFCAQSKAACTWPACSASLLLPADAMACDGGCGGVRGGGAAALRRCPNSANQGWRLPGMPLLR